MLQPDPNRIISGSAPGQIAPCASSFSVGEENRRAADPCQPLPGGLAGAGVAAVMVAPAIRPFRTGGGHLQAALFERFPALYIGGEAIRLAQPGGGVFLPGLGLPAPATQAAPHRLHDVATPWDPARRQKA